MRHAIVAESDRHLALANSYTYDTWGRPTSATHNGVGDLGFRFLYVGASDVQWDDAFGLGLLYMHARTTARPSGASDRDERYGRRHVRQPVSRPTSQDPLRPGVEARSLPINPDGGTS